MEKIIAYVKNSIAELHKVTWPTKKQTFNYSVLVIAISVGMALFFMVLDYILNLGIGSIIK